MATQTSSLIVSLVDRVTAPARAVARSLEGLNQRAWGGGFPEASRRLDASIARTDEALSRARGGIVDAVGSWYMLKGAIGGPVQAAREFESAMADVKKVVDFPTPDGLQQFQKDLMELSTRIPVTVNGLAEIAAAAGQNGVAAEDLVAFTEAAAKIGVAFDISAGDAGLAMAKLQTGLGLTLDEVIRLSDAMNHLSNNQAATAAEVLDIVRRVGAMGKQYGFTAEETAAFGSAMVASGAQTEVAATSFMNMGRALTRGASATKRQSAAFQKLGLDAEDVARRMQEDAVGTTIDVMERMSQLPAEMRASVSSDLFGDEARALGPLLTNLNLIRESVGLVAKESEYAGSAFKEFEVRAATFDNAVITFNNRMHALKVVIGEALIPAINELIERLTPVVAAITDFARADPELIRGLLMATAGVIAFRGAIAALRFAGLLGKSGVLNLAAMGLHGIGGTAARLVGAARASMALQTALAAMSGVRLGNLAKIGAGLRGIIGATPGLRLVGPAIGAVTAALGAISAPVWAGIAAAIVAVGAAWKYWDRISAIVRGVARAVGEALRPAIEAVGEWLSPLTPILDGFSAAWDRVKDAMQSVVDFVMGGLSGLFSREVLTPEESAELEERARDVAKRVIDRIKAIPAGIIAAGAEMFNAGLEIIQKLWDGMVQKFEDLMEWVRAIPGRIKDAVGDIVFTTQDEAASSYMNSNPTMRDPRVDGARRSGGPVSAGGTYQVGEDGPEIITPTRSGYVHPTGKGPGGAPITVSAPITINAVPGESAESLARRVKAILDRELGASMRAALADI
ncbi:phage tail tape measure protein [Paracoccus sp. DMF-8]|uniref:phage tail tape measure protein n=1 Tax=Paracoccus sp. DMF-8 TaxID=3019445 RepID=UPI0023E8C8C3|nr:phage tail tape measure protein [Paracoccus sp. DMF-8]MDF3606570.1 phage tail tape measure protein [Paracoccus sp. DMF-8]